MAEMGGHEIDRTKICVVCSRHASRKKPLSDADIKSIKEYVDNEFNPDNPDYPCALCNGCYLLLDKKRNGNDVVIKIDQEYKPDAGISKFLRSPGSNCNWSICEIVNSICSTGNINAQVAKKKKRGRPKDTSVPVAQTKKICNRCLSDIYRGCRHYCRSDRYRIKKVNNAETLISTPTSSEKLAARTIRKSIGYNSISNDDFMVPALKKAMDQVAPKRLFSADDMCIVRKDLNLSTRKMLQLCQDLREISDDRKIIEKSFKRKMVDMSHKIEKFLNTQHYLSTVKSMLKAKSILKILTSM